IIDAERVQLNKASFNKNVDHPIAGGQAATGRAALNRQITIDASNFMGNAASILALDAVVTVRDSKFSGNGSGPAASGASWGCCAGVLTAVNSKVFFYDSELVGNGAAGFGGAILAIGSEVHLVRTLLQSNRARIGGAVFSWGQAINSNIWSSTGVAHLSPGLVLVQARFHENIAQFGGGAVAWSGPVTGNAALFAKNEADAGGALAHWSAIALASDFALAFSELVSMTTAGDQSLALSKGIFVENKARNAGAAVAG